MPQGIEHLPSTLKMYRENHGAKSLQEMSSDSLVLFISESICSTTIWAWFSSRNNTSCFGKILSKLSCIKSKFSISPQFFKWNIILQDAGIDNVNVFIWINPVDKCTRSFPRCYVNRGKASWRILWLRSQRRLLSGSPCTIAPSTGVILLLQRHCSVDITQGTLVKNKPPFQSHWLQLYSSNAITMSCPGQGTKMQFLLFVVYPSSVLKISQGLVIYALMLFN
jgi:hypothetical protein